MVTSESTLDPRQEYVWFISYIEIRRIKSIPTLIIDWNNKEVDIVIREYLRIPQSDFRSSRLYRMMIAIGYEDTDKSKVPEWEKFIVKGLHIRAKPLKVWGDMSSETMWWKLNYDTITSLEAPDKSSDIPDEDMKKLIQLISRQANHKEALVKVATIRPDWVKAYLALYESGQAKFSS